MAGQEPTGYDRLPQTARSIDDFQELLHEAVSDEQEGEPKRPPEGGLFSIYLHERPFRMPRLPDRQEVGNFSPNGEIPAIAPAIESNLPFHPS